MRQFYTLLIRFYYFLLGLASPFYSKAAIWRKNRKHWSDPLERLKPGKQTIWMHAASAGEFEQAIPVIEQIRRSGEALQIAVSFYSASGFELYKDSDYADVFFYLPADYPGNAKKLVAKLNPAVAVFIRNEIWWNLLHELKKQEVPAILMNADPEKRTGWYGRYLATCYTYFTRIFYTNIVGNTKQERALSIAKTAHQNTVIENFAENSFVLMLGSCYEAEVKLAAEFYNTYQQEFPNFKIIFCPHEWNEKTLPAYQKYFKENIELYSSCNINSRLLLIDKMGILKYIYRYADAAIVGGGFGKGIHNVLEASVYEIPVFIGPAYKKYPEIISLVRAGLVFEISSEKELNDQLYPVIKTGKEQPLLAKEKWRQYFHFFSNTSIIIWKEMQNQIRR